MGSLGSEDGTRPGLSASLTAIQGSRTCLLSTSGNHDTGKPGGAGTVHCRS